MLYQEYLKLATKISTKYQRNKDDECIADVFNALVKAFNGWDGRGDKMQYTVYMGKLAARRYIYKQRSVKKLMNIDDVDIIIKTPSTLKNMITREFLDDTSKMLSSVLSAKELECFNMRVKEGMTMQEIGEKFSCTKQNISLIIQNVTEKLKTHLGDKYNEYLELVQ